MRQGHGTDAVAEGDLGTLLDVAVQWTKVRGLPAVSGPGSGLLPVCGFLARSFRAYQTLSNFDTHAYIWGSCSKADLEPQVRRGVMVMSLMLGPHLQEPGFKGGINGNSNSQSPHLDNGLASTFYLRVSIFQIVYIFPAFSRHF